MSNLNNNTTQLEALLAKVNALPEAGSGGDDPFKDQSPFSYSVNDVSGASYGFLLNEAGYYESQNKGKQSSYAICRVDFNVTSTCDIVFDVINYAETTYDYAVFGALDIALALSNSADSTAKENFKGRQSPSVVNVTYSGVTAGSHYIDIKFIKDSSQNNNNDSVQFKVQEPSLSQETIDKILAADTDLVSENIKSGVDIFGVVGTYEGNGGSSGGNEDSVFARTATTYDNNTATAIGAYAFYRYTNLKSVNFQQCKTIGSSAFYWCSGLTEISFPQCTTINVRAFEDTVVKSISFPECTTIGNYAFYCCSLLTSINFPKATTIGTNAFNTCYSLANTSFPNVTTIGASAFKQCSKLTSISLPECTSIGSYAFNNCTKLSSIYLIASSVCTLVDTNAFNYTYCSIFVPASLVDAYKSATNWTYYSSRIFAYSSSGGAD